LLQCAIGPSARLARAALTFANSKAPPKQAAGQPDSKMLLNASGRIFLALAQHLRNFRTNTSGPNGRTNRISKFQFNGGGGSRTYIGFTHSAFS
jgi:hypothetical protein